MGLSYLSIVGDRRYVVEPIIDGSDSVSRTDDTVVQNLLTGISLTVLDSVVMNLLVNPNLTISELVVFTHAIVGSAVVL